jgi:predicted DsbA family dithiol-disulfide isomerase
MLNRLAVLRGAARLANTRQLTAAAAPHIVIDIVSDIRCPWCFIGKRRLERAIRSIPPTAATFEVKWFPYMLDDELTAEGVDRKQYYLDKFGEDNTEAFTTQMATVFRQEGISHHYDIEGIASSSLDAHRLVAKAQAQGKQDAVSEALFHAYFTDNKNIADLDVLEAIGEASGVEGARAFLEGDELSAEVCKEAAGHKGHGLTIPHYTVTAGDGAPQALPGCQDTGDFAALFRSLAGVADEGGEGGYTAYENLLPQMLAGQGFPLQCPFVDEHFARSDESLDTVFYESTRFVQHIDGSAVRTNGRTDERTNTASVDSV